MWQCGIGFPVTTAMVIGILARGSARWGGKWVGMISLKRGGRTIGKEPGVMCVSTEKNYLGTV